MKKLLIVLGTAIVFTACKHKQQTPADQTMVLSAADSAALKEFREWKSKKENAAVKAQPSTVANNSSNASAPVEQKSTKKKGWSKAAKGAVIGAGTGAVAGAIINKRNRAAGAAIGAVIGGGAGYGIGRSQDKKDGRY